MRKSRNASGILIEFKHVASSTTWDSLKKNANVIELRNEIIKYANNHDIEIKKKRKL